MVLLGTDDDGHPVALSAEGRRQGTYVLGINGTGKTNLLLDIALQDMEAGDGVCVIDPHGDLTEDLLQRVPDRRMDDVILFDPTMVDYPFGLNLMELQEVDDALKVDRLCAEIIATLKKQFDFSWGPRLEDVLRHSVLTLMATPNRTLLDILRLLTDDEAREEYVERTEDPILRHFWRTSFPKNASTRSEVISPVLNKMGRFLTNPVIRNIVCQPKSTFDFRTVMDEGKILLVNLSKGLLGDDNSALLGSTLVGKLLIAALSRSDIHVSRRRQFHLIVDEYHSFATDSFPTLQSEARKFAIDTIVAHQFRAQLDELNFGSTLNAGNFILFRTTGVDARDLALQFNNEPPPAEPILQPIPRRTGQPGIYRTTGGMQYAAGDARTYSDIERETANQLVNVGNFEAHCNLIEKGRLREAFIRTRRVNVPASPDKAKRLKEEAQKIGTPRAEVEAQILSLWQEAERVYSAD